MSTCSPGARARPRRRGWPTPRKGLAKLAVAGLLVPHDGEPAPARGVRPRQGAGTCSGRYARRAMRNVELRPAIRFRAHARAGDGAGSPGRGQRSRSATTYFRERSRAAQAARAGPGRGRADRLPPSRRSRRRARASTAAYRWRRPAGGASRSTRSWWCKAPQLLLWRTAHHLDEVEGLGSFSSWRRWRRGLDLAREREKVERLRRSAAHRGCKPGGRSYSDRPPRRTRAPARSRRLCHAQGHAPYSEFPVGAALRAPAADLRGRHVENALSQGQAPRLRRSVCSGGLR